MIDFLQPFPGPVLLALDELTDGIERGRGEMARLRFVGKIISVEFSDEFRECPGDFVPMLIAIAWIFPLRSGKRLIVHPVLCELLPHVRHARREVHIAAVFAAIDIRTGAAVSLSPWAPFETILARIAGDRAAVGKRQRFLERHIDAL